MWLYIIIAIIVVFLLVLTTYNSFVRLNNRVKEAFSTMDVYLKKRWDLIPNIAIIFNYKTKNMFQSTEEERQNVKVSF